MPTRIRRPFLPFHTPWFSVGFLSFGRFDPVFAPQITRRYRHHMFWGLRITPSPKVDCELFSASFELEVSKIASWQKSNERGKFEHAVGMLEDHYRDLQTQRSINKRRFWDTKSADPPLRPPIFPKLLGFHHVFCRYCC